VAEIDVGGAKTRRSRLAGAGPIACLLSAALALAIEIALPNTWEAAKVVCLIVAVGVSILRLGTEGAMAARIDALLRRTDALVPIDGADDGIDRLEGNVAQIEAVLCSFEHRLAQRHPISGLPTREPLFARIESDIAVGVERGLLGVVGFVDFERLVAFDPGLADRAFATVIERALRMLGTLPMVAQVDRSRLAIWFGAGCDIDQAEVQLDALGYALGDAIGDGDRELLPEIRVGTAFCPQAAVTPERLLARAIAALAQTAATAAQPEGDPVEAARERYALEQDLRRAVSRAEFELQYQPLIDAAAGRVCGAEALLRWQHPVQGPIPPSRFVPIMESAGLADEVGLWTLNAACREARGWQRQDLGHGAASLRIAVNVSGRQLARPDMRALIERTLARHSLAPAVLEIELTETVATGDVESAAALFAELRTLGIAIAIDDFGTGYSSFSALRSLVFDKIKIDREFVTSVDSRTDSQAICRSIIALGQGLGIRVLAEGVERHEEYAWLRGAGCTHFQGYYFAAPLEPAAFVDFVRDVPRLTALLSLSPIEQPLPERLRA
jgi:EAL domain-containing protein (putative c-di-GMP-specific phosphodiesterase class I)/GGDEF domain-containing protein